MKMTGAQIICEALKREGVEVIFGHPGGTILPLYDEITDHPSIRHILVRHEQAGAHAAEGYARSTGGVGVCFATSGPGATNLVTGLTDAMLDSVPIVAITGQVGRPVIGKDAFQETDVTGITLPVTKHNYLVLDPRDLPIVFKEAFHIARTGRPGPVLIDIPKDVQQEEIEPVWPEKINLPGYKPVYKGHSSQIKKAAKLINDAERPLIVAGHGVHIAGAESELIDFAERAQIPVANTLLGIGNFPEQHVLSLGMLGMHGMAWSNLASISCDVMIAIGMRMDDRVTGDPSAFASQAQIVHIDIDPAELGKNVEVRIPIVGDAKAVLAELNRQIDQASHSDWLRQLDEWRRDHPSRYIRETDEILPQWVIREIHEVTNGEAVVVTGVGQHQMWAAQHYLFDRAENFITSGGLGTMGYGLPAAMGAAVGRPESDVWLIDGDGSFQQTLQELGTIAQEQIPVKICVLNNNFLGMVRQWQQFFYGKNYAHTDMFTPDFVKLGEAYGIPAYSISEKGGVRPALEAAKDTPGPVLIEFKVAREENCFPMIPSGMTVNDMMEEPIPEEVKVWHRKSTR